MKKKVTLLTSFILGTICVSVLTLITACDSKDSDMPSIVETEIDSEPIIGTASYIQMLSNLKESETSQTRSLDDESEVSDETIQSLIYISQEYLALNDIDMSDVFDQDDPRLAIVAMAIADVDRINNNAAVSRTTFGGCVLEGLGVKGLVNGMGKKAAAKIIGKFLLKRAIPYIGWSLFAYDFIDCMIE